MKSKRWLATGIGLAVLLGMLTGCGNERPAASLSETAGTDSMPSSSYMEQYGTSLFLGDSITEGLIYHDVLKEENVLAGAGKTAEFALMTEDVRELIDRKPERVYIQLGSDDILWPTDQPIAYSLAHYGELIDKIRDGLPKARITLLSVAPVTDEAEKQEPRYRTIAAYNAGLEALADEKRVDYLDLTPLVAAHEELYDTDGIHFQAAFYPLLLDYLSQARTD